MHIKNVTATGKNKRRNTKIKGVRLGKLHSRWTGVTHLAVETDHGRKLTIHITETSKAPETDGAMHCESKGRGQNQEDRRRLFGSHWVSRSPHSFPP